MLKTQEPKYDCTPEGRIVNRTTHRVIPDDEPVFILRAQDKNAAEAIRYYASLCASPDHRAVVTSRALDFKSFADHNPDRMKEPGPSLQDIAGADVSRGAFTGSN